MIMFLKVYLVLGIVVALIGLLGLDKRETTTFTLVAIVLSMLLLWPYALVEAHWATKNKTDDEINDDIDCMVEWLDKIGKES